MSAICRMSTGCISIMRDGRVSDESTTYRAVRRIVGTFDTSPTVSTHVEGRLGGPAIGINHTQRACEIRTSVRSIHRLRALSHRRTELAARTSAPSRIMSSQFGQTRTVPRPVGANTRTYRCVTNELQLSQRAMPGKTPRRVNGVRHGSRRTLSWGRDVELTATVRADG